LSYVDIVEPKAAYRQDQLACTRMLYGYVMPVACGAKAAGHPQKPLAFEAMI